MPTALVSVVIPVHNRAYAIVESVRSVLEQTYPHVECLVVDDGSTDGTGHAVREAFAGDPRVTLLAQEHAGVSAARNLGITHSRGQFVTFLDSDDVMVSRRIALQLEALEDPSNDAVVGRQEQVLVGTRSRPQWLEQHPEWWDDYYHTSILVATDRVRDVGGFDEDLHLGEDVDLMVRLVGAGVRVVKLDEVLVTRRYFGDNVTYGMSEADHGALLKAVRRHLARRRDGKGDESDRTAAGELSLQATRLALLEAEDTWRQVSERGSCHSLALSFAGVPIEISIAGDELADMLRPAFDGVPRTSAPVTGVVGAWDASATTSGLPAPPFARPGDGFRSTVRRAGHPIAEVEWSSAAEVFRAADRDARQFLLAVGSPSALSPREGGAPLRRQLVWALGPEVLFVHAAAVGSPDGVALLMGPGGSGKSSTSLACLQSGMGFLADDYCLVRDHPPVVHQLYTTARLGVRDVDRFSRFVAPAIAAESVDPEMESDEKALYQLHRDFADQLVESAPARLLVVLEAHGDAHPTFQAISPAAALKRIAPSTLWQMNVDPAAELAGLRCLVSELPCFLMSLSRDRAANPPVIRDALRRLQRG